MVFCVGFFILFVMGNREVVVFKFFLVCVYILVCDDFVKGKVEGDWEVVRWRGVFLNFLVNWNK